MFRNCVIAAAHSAVPKDVIFRGCYLKGNVKCTLVQALRLCTGRTAHRGSRGIALLFLDHGIRRGWGVSVTPWTQFTPRKEPVPFVQEAGRPQGRSGQVRKISPPPGFDPRTVQSVASRYTDYANRPVGLLVTVSISKVCHSKIVVDCQTLKMETLPSSETSVFFLPIGTS